MVETANARLNQQIWQTFAKLAKTANQLVCIEHKSLRKMCKK